MNERELAENICKTQVQSIVDEFSGATISGSSIADRYFEKWTVAGYDVNDGAEALRHWLVCAGYAKSGRFVYVLSTHHIRG